MERMDKNENVNFLRILLNYWIIAELLNQNPSSVSQPVMSKNSGTTVTALPSSPAHKGEKQLQHQHVTASVYH